MAEEAPKEEAKDPAAPLPEPQPTEKQPESRPAVSAQVDDVPDPDEDDLSDLDGYSTACPAIGFAEGLTSLHRRPRRVLRRQT
jgi:hypothetical protein